MTTTTFASRIFLFLSLSVLLLIPTLQVAQQGDSGASTKAFVGVWKGTCADGGEFVVLKLSQRGDSIAGTISIANMSGPKGRCGSVIDPPTDEHAMQIHDVQLQRKDLAFKGAGKTAFEMDAVGDDARLKFLGTPVESNPWKLKRVK